MRRPRTRGLEGLRIVLLVGVVAALGVLGRTPAAGEPSYGVGAGFGPPPAAIFEPFYGAPTFSPIPAVPVIGGGALGLPAAANTDALSYGNDFFPPAAGWHAIFSVAPGSTGHPGSPPAGPYPNVLLEGPLLPAGDGSVVGDLYSSFNMAVGPPGAYAIAGPPAPCGPIHSNIQVGDEDGLMPALMPNVALGQPIGVNLDTIEMSDNGFVDFLPPGGDGLPDAPVFFSVDPATAAGMPPLPPGFGPVTPADVLAWDPGTAALYNWAPGALLGLPPGNNVDALAVGYVSGVAIPLGYAGPPDTILFSLAAGSPALGLLPSICFGPGTATASDVFAFGVAPGIIPVIDAEMMGLDTLRSGGPANDDLDALDILVDVIADTDGDLLTNSVDMDDDNDGLGDGAEAPNGCLPLVADTDGDGLSDYTEVVVLGTSCALADTDGDGLSDSAEVNGIASPKAALGILFSNPTLVDTDGDGCSDGEELGPAEMFGGRRDPMNGFDFYDINGDRAIDLFIDIFGVAGLFGASAPGPPYIASYDRGPPYANVWNITGPDGTIDLFIDIFGVAYQFGHDCTAAP